MAAQLRIDFSSGSPIWRQIVSGVRWLVATGEFPAGSAMPSVREMARELRVNPDTVAKAYQQLKSAGVLTVRRGEGTYVCQEPPPLESHERARALREAAVRFTSSAVTLGAGYDEAIAEIDEAWGATIPWEAGGKG